MKAQRTIKTQPIEARFAPTSSQERYAKANEAAEKHYKSADRAFKKVLKDSASTTLQIKIACRKFLDAVSVSNVISDFYYNGEASKYWKLTRKSTPESHELMKRFLMLVPAQYSKAQWEKMHKAA